VQFVPVLPALRLSSQYCCMLAQSALMHLPMAFSPAAAEACVAVATNSRPATAQINLDSIMCPPKSNPYNGRDVPVRPSNCKPVKLYGSFSIDCIAGPPEAGACCNVLAARPCSRARWQRPVRRSSRLFNLARLAGSFLRFTGIEPIITRKTARQKNRRASLSVLACPARNRRRRTNKNYN
jgi:hypothetical protein